ncbi:MAG: DUF5916 domain-containing protein [Gemmatimonadaceae bacterium]
MGHVADALGARMPILLATAMALLLQGAALAPIDGKASPALVRIPRIETEITIDANLSEPAWEKAARLTGFSQYAPVDHRPADESTEVRVFYTPDAIYFGFIATAADPGSVRATLSKRDAISNDDRITVYLDTFNDHRRAFFFGVNPLGVQLDGVRTDGAMSAGSLMGGSIDLNPDFRFDTRGRMTSTGYVVEMRIPFKSLRFPTNDPQRWGIQVVRDNPSRGTQDTWPAASRGSSSFLAQSATMEGIERVVRGIVTDVQPFITEAVSGTRDGVSGRLSHDGGTFDGGANIRVAFPALALDGTINPDFSQVEADAGLVTVNERFTLFLPERRPFFLEGIELFATPNQLVYSRQIANPIAGAKVTGKLGRFGIAYLSALDDRAGKDALFNIFRLRTDYGGNSVAGLTVTDRHQGDSSNTVVAVDTRYVFRNLYYTELQVGQSLTTTGPGVTKSAPVWKAEVDRTGRIYGFNYNLSAFGDRFRSDAGFVPRVGYQSFHGFNRLAFFGGPKALVQSFTVYAGPTRLWRYGQMSRSAQLEGDDLVGTFLSLRGGWQLSPGFNRKFFVVDPMVGAGLFAPSIEGALVPWNPTTRLDNLWSGSLGITTPVFGRLNASMNVQRGDVPLFVEGVVGHQFLTSASLTLRPSAGTRIEGTLTHDVIRRAIDDSPFARVFIPRIKAEYQPTRALFFRVVSQYRADRVYALRNRFTGEPLYDGEGIAVAPSDARFVRTDWLVQYEPSPGTIAFFGYGDSWGSPGAVFNTNLHRETDGIFVKLAYLFRR